MFFSQTNKNGIAKEFGMQIVTVLKKTSVDPLELMLKKVILSLNLILH